MTARLAKPAHNLSSTKQSGKQEIDAPIHRAFKERYVAVKMEEQDE
jgi:hypothetical protein